MEFACATNKKYYGGVAILYNLGDHTLDSLLCNQQSKPEKKVKKKEENVESEENQQSEEDCDNFDYETINKVGVLEGLGDPDLDREGRILSCQFKNFVLVSVYTPHSGVGELKRLDFRVNQWDRAFQEHINKLKAVTGKEVIVCGDLNIIRHNCDIYNPKWCGQRPGSTDLERDSFETILSQCALDDSFRAKYPLRMLVYSHWTDRCGIARKNNWGSRMDYFLTSQSLRAQIKDVKYWAQIEGSDHCPLSIDLAIQDTKQTNLMTEKEKESKSVEV